MTFIKLTAPNGSAVWVNRESICVVAEAVGEATSARSVIFHNSGRQAVRENVEGIIVQLEKECG